MTPVRRINLVFGLFLGSLGSYLFDYVERKRPSQTKHTLDDTTAADGDNRNESVLEPFECRIYIAPSSVKGIHGFGMYTVEDIPENESFLQAPDGPSVVVTDYDQKKAEVDPEAHKLWLKVFNNYWWGRGVPDQVSYEAIRVMDFQITFGSLPNHHCSLSVIDHRRPAIPYDDTMVQSEGPGAGAFSYHMGRDFYATRLVRAGEELFLNYGYCDDPLITVDESGEEERSASYEPKWAKDVPKSGDFDDAALASLWLLRKVEQRSSSSDTAQENFYVRQREKLIDFEGMREQAANLVPRSLNELYEVIRANNGSLDIDLVGLELAKRLGTSPRTVEWIKKNGMCIENIVPGKSAIPYAGQGAILQTSIRQGDIIVPIPLLQIVNRDVLATFDFDGGKVGEQLLLNYCFGHHESSLLLCPNSNAILVNHCSEPNTMVRWASGWDPQSDLWRNFSLQEMRQHTDRGLSMELVALRDLQPGEEVTIDYGSSWESAWNSHVGKSKQSMTPMSIKELNDPTKPIREEHLTFDPRKDSYDSSSRVFATCVYWSGSLDYMAPFTHSTQWETWSDELIYSIYLRNGAEFTIDETYHGELMFWPCSVISEDSNSAYIVRIDGTHFLTEEKLPWDTAGVPRVLSSYPRESIQFYYQPYKSDQHSIKSFRHYIPVADELFPEIWKDRKGSS